MILVAGLIVGVIAGLMVQIGSTGGPRQPEPSERSPAGILFVTHSPIYINGNAEFTLGNGVTSGTGTASDPYIIADWDINASSAIAGAGIYIANADAHFIVRNCYVYYGFSSNSEGIELYNCVNGTIENNICSDDIAGISLALSSGNSVINNSCLGNHGNGISTFSSSNSTLFNNTCVSNTVFGMFISQSNNNTFDSNNCSSNINTGMFLYTSSNNTLINNNCSDNDQRGIYLDTESGDTLLGNNVSMNAAQGVYLVSSSNNVITWNHLYKNLYHGVIISSSSCSSNLIAHNAFVDNNEGFTQAWDQGTDNSWNDTDGKGNFWSDWTTPDANHDGIVDSPYMIDGSANAEDYYPLASVSQATISEFGMMPLVVIVLAAIMLTMRIKRQKSCQ